MGMGELHLGVELCVLCKTVKSDYESVGRYFPLDPIAIDAHCYTVYAILPYIRHKYLSAYKGLRFVPEPCWAFPIPPRCDGRWSSLSAKVNNTHPLHMCTR